MSSFGVMIDRIDDDLNKAGTLDNQIGRSIITATNHYRAKRFFFNEDVVASNNATTIGAAYINYPTTFVTLDSIQMDDGSGFYDLIKKPFRSLDELSQSPSETGPPVYYCEYQGQIRLWPIPDKTTYDFIFAGVIEFPTLVMDADTNAWMTDGEELIRQRAKANVLCDVLRDPVAKQEAMTLAMTPRGRDCLSIMERSALEMLTNQTLKRKTRGRAVPRNF